MPLKTWTGYRPVFAREGWAAAAINDGSSRQPASLKNMHSSRFITTFSWVTPACQIMLNIHPVIYICNTHIHSERGGEICVSTYI